MLELLVVSVTVLSVLLLLWIGRMLQEGEEEDRLLSYLRGMIRLWEQDRADPFSKRMVTELRDLEKEFQQGRYKKSPRFWTKPR